MDGLTAAAELKEAPPDTKIVILTTFGSTTPPRDGVRGVRVSVKDSGRQVSHIIAGGFHVRHRSDPAVAAHGDG
jgi:hypothetical protein